MSEVDRPTTTKGLAPLAARGAAWSVGGLLIAEPIRILVTAVLARLLTPSDFGLLGIATIVVGLATIGNDFGLQAAVIQRAALDDNALSSLFWLNMAAGILLAGLLAAFSPVVATIFNEPDAGPLIAVLAFGLVIVSFVQIQNALLRRGFNFRLPAIANIVSVLSAGAVAIGCALAGFGVWSLVVNSLVASVVTAVIVQSRVRFRPRMHFKWEEVAGLVGFGSKIMVADLAQYGAGTVDNAVVGYSLGPIALGPYALAYNLMTYPARRLSAVLASATFPAFARLQDDKKRMSAGLRRSVAVSSLVVLPLTACAAVCGRQLIIGLYGPQWIDAIIPFQVLCLAAAGRSIAVHAENVFKASGRSDLVLYWSVLGLLAVGPAAAAGLSWGLVGVSVGVAAATATVSVGTLLYASRLLDVGIRGAIAPLLLPAALSLVAIAASWLVLSLASSLPDLLAAVLAILAGMASALVVGWRSAPMRDTLELAKGLMHRSIDSPSA